MRCLTERNDTYYGIGLPQWTIMHVEHLCLSVRHVDRVFFRVTGGVLHILCKILARGMCL